MSQGADGARELGMVPNGREGLQVPKLRAATGDILDNAGTAAGADEHRLCQHLVDEHRLPIGGANEHHTPEALLVKDQLGQRLPARIDADALLGSRVRQLPRFGELVPIHEHDAGVLRPCRLAAPQVRMQGLRCD